MLLAWHSALQSFMLLAWHSALHSWQVCPTPGACEGPRGYQRIVVTNPLTFDSGPGVLAGTQVLPRVGGRVSCPPLCPGSPTEAPGTDGTTPQGPVLAAMLVTS